jgi:formylglycine-generating enzyme required for sulfatase activity
LINFFGIRRDDMKNLFLTVYLLLFFALLSCDSSGGGSNDGGGEDSNREFSAGEKETFMADSLSFVMAYLPGGLNYMAGVNDDGDKNNDGDTTDPEDEPGGTHVSNAYWIGETEVTYELWDKVYDWATDPARGADIYTFANTGTMGYGAGAANQDPVVTVNWRDCMVWCNALTEWYNTQAGTNYGCVYLISENPVRDSQDSNGAVCDNVSQNTSAKGFRLPTSDEWELPARYIDDKNSDGDIIDTGEYYPGDFLSGADADYDDTPTSDYDADGDIEGSGDVANYTSSGTMAVKSKSPNALGLYDMSGNVYEWCFDLSGSERVNRGASYIQIASVLQIGEWNDSSPDYEFRNLGFRLAKTQ